VTDAQITSGTYTDFKVTRQGDFRTDKDGYLVNGGGYKLLGIPVDATTGTATAATGSLVPIKLATAGTTTGSATTAVNITANLPATDTVTSDPHEVNVTAYDASGNEFNLVVSFQKSSTDNTWTGQLVSASSTSDETLTGTVTANATTFTFDGDGTLTSPTSGVSLGSVTLSNGNTISPSFTFKVGGQTTLQQQSDIFTAGAVAQNGFGPGALSGVSFDENGIVTANYTNGASKALYMVPLINYAAINGLNPLSGNAFEATSMSGAATAVAAGNGGIGKFTPSSLESSTVDLADEFTNMIITQRAYSADTKIITTADEMYQSLVQMARG
jgi:flagellar hook protein FlgE